MGLSIVASSSMVLTLVNAQADQIISGVGSSTMTLTLVNAAMTSAVSAQASSTMSIAANLSLGGIIPVEAASSMVVSVNCTMTALAGMIAAAGGPTPLSPEGLANAVWSEPLTSYSGLSAGQALKDAGSAGNPWAAELSSNNTPNTFGWFIQKLLTVSKFLGLK
jgi:hypothetical protein